MNVSRRAIITRQFIIMIHLDRIKWAELSTEATVHTNINVDEELRLVLAWDGRLAACPAQSRYIAADTPWHKCHKRYTNHGPIFGPAADHPSPKTAQNETVLALAIFLQGRRQLSHPAPSSSVALSTPHHCNNGHHAHAQ